MNFPKPENKKEKMNQKREAYLVEKEDLTAYYEQCGFDKSELNQFLVNSLKDSYEDELREDGII